MELINFIIEELNLREDDAHKGIKKLRIALDNQKEDLLAFAQILDQKLADIARKFQISLAQVRQADGETTAKIIRQERRKRV